MLAAAAVVDMQVLTVVVLEAWVAEVEVEMGKAEIMQQDMDLEAVAQAVRPAAAPAASPPPAIDLPVLAHRLLDVLAQLPCASPAATP